MKKILIILALVCTSFINAAATPEKTTTQSADTEGSVVLFTPPTGWHMADPSALPPHIRVMVVGKGPSSFPPSMNLNVQSYNGTLKQYLKVVKETNESQGYEWKDLGTIRTEAGNASLSQFDHKSQWGVIRMMQVIMIKNRMVYILSASALADEFSMFYKDFFAAMRSLRVTKDPVDMLTSSQQKTQLRNATQNLKNQWQTEITKKRSEDNKGNPNDIKTTVFNSPDFQKSAWVPFKEMISQKYGMMGADWQTIVLNNTEKDLFDTQLN
jgi:hypothetical protein